MVINKLNKDKKDYFDGELCIWCGYPISREEGNEAVIRWGKLLHEYCQEDHHENNDRLTAEQQELYPIEDGFTFGPATPLSAKEQLSEHNRVGGKGDSHFNVLTNRYEYKDGSPVAIQSELIDGCNLPSEGLPWENKDYKNKTAPDGSSIKSGWGERSSWGDPRPLG
jgi:hypothetical protein